MASELTGRTLDEAIQERFFGKCGHHWEQLSANKFLCSKCGKRACGGDANVAQGYSTDWSSAGLLVARLRELGWCIRAVFNELGSYVDLYRSFEPYTSFISNADTFPHALCRAALLTVENQPC